jgi:hypothetical protein
MDTEKKIEDDGKLRLRDWEDALQSQDACNLSGIVFSFARVMERICKECKGGTDERNRHPICRMYAEQIVYLSGGGGGSSYSTLSEARDKIQAKIAELKAAQLEKEQASNGES